MDYIIPDNIKKLCAKLDLSDPVEQDLVKREIIKYLNDYLDLDKGKNSLANVTDIVRDFFNVVGTNYPFERDIAGRMMRTRNYTMKEEIAKNGKEDVYVIAADRDWWTRINFGFLLLCLL